MDDRLHGLGHLLHRVDCPRALLLHSVHLPEAALAQDLHHCELVLGEWLLLGGRAALLLLEEHVVEEGEVLVWSAGGAGLVLATGRLEGHALLYLVLQVAIGPVLRSAGRRLLLGLAVHGGLLGAGSHHSTAVLAMVVLSLHLQIIYCQQLRQDHALIAPPPATAKK